MTVVQSLYDIFIFGQFSAELIDSADAAYKYYFSVVPHI